MYIVQEFSHNSVRRVELKDMNFHHFKWLDIENPSSKELTQIADVVKLPEHELQICLDPNELPRVMHVNGFSFVIIKTPYLHKHRSTTTSLTLIVSERLIITLHQEPIEAISILRDSPEADIAFHLSKGAQDFLFHLLERITKEYFVILDTVENAINHLEDHVFTKPDQTQVKKIFNLKRTLIYFHKALSANRDVLTSLQKSPHMSDDTKSEIDHLYYDVIQLIEVVAIYRDILTGTLDIYLSAVSNNMNSVMKKMAAYGTLVLVPTFITGLYGMNFHYMPELQWQYGYLFAWGVIVISIVLLIWYFKKQDWF